MKPCPALMAVESSVAAAMGFCEVETSDLASLHTVESVSVAGTEAHGWGLHARLATARLANEDAQM